MIITLTNFTYNKKLGQVLIIFCLGFVKILINELFANTLYNIASSYQAIGKYKDAIKLYEISIEIYLLIYGEKDNIFVDLVYECIKECDIDGSHMKDVRENSTNPLNSKFLSYKEKNQSKACIIS